MKTIGRRITVTTCRGTRLIDDRFVPFSDELYGKQTIERATRALRREYHDMTIVISEVSSESAYYKMPLMEFMRQATKSGVREEK